MIQELILGITLFTFIIMVLTGIILFVRTCLFSSNQVSITINSDKTLVADIDRKLLNILSEANLLLPSACGGRGTCGQCKLVVNMGGGAILPTETVLLKKGEIAENTRLACQLIVKQDLDISLPEEILGVKKWTCTLASSHNVSTFIRELIFDLPAGEELTFRAGSYVMIDCPPSQVSFRDFDIDSIYLEEWDRFDMWRFNSTSRQMVSRAYSLANYPAEKSIAMLNVRIATPPPGASVSIPPGIVSSYLFSLKPGDEVSIYGPYGHFFAQDTQKEMVFIGGGAGMAPMRSHIFDLLLRLKSSRKISFWYGARNRRELFYEDVFMELENNHDNFHWYVALSDPQAGDNWGGYTGLIHRVIYDYYLKDHPTPELCEYYICGPSLMNSAVLKMLVDLGVERQDIILDDFGGQI